MSRANMALIVCCNYSNIYLFQIRIIHLEAECDLIDVVLGIFKMYM